MGFFIKLLITAWPFIKEMILGNKPIKDFLVEHKWVFGHIGASLLLFFLFINQLLGNVHLKMETTEYQASIKNQVEFMTGRIDRQATRIDDLRSQVTDLREMNKVLRKELDEQQTAPKEPEVPSSPPLKPQEALVDTAPIILPPVTPPTETIRSRSYLDKLEQLRQSDY